jgi:hypothetical protein
MKALFYKIPRFFEGQIRPNERACQAKQHEKAGIRQRIAQNERRAADGTKI